MKNQIFTPAQKIAMLVVLVIFITALTLAKLNAAGFTTSQFTNF